MSFGAGVGDVIQVTRLVKQASQNIKSAPEDFRAAEDTVRSLDLLLDSIGKEVRSETSVFKRDPAQDERFGILLRLCLAPLEKLNDLLDRFQSLGTGNVKILDRLKFSKRTVQDIQRELSLRYANLSAFLDNIGLGGIGRIEHKVEGLREQQNRILSAIDKVVGEAFARQETASVVSEYTNDDKSVWRQLRRDLNAAGFKSADLERHKMLIFNKLIELHRSGLLDFDGTPDDNKSDSTVMFVAFDRANYSPPTLNIVHENREEEQILNATGNYKPATASTVCDDSEDERERSSRTLPTVDEQPPDYHDAVEPQVMNTTRPWPTPQGISNVGPGLPQAATDLRALRGATGNEVSFPVRRLSNRQYNNAIPHRDSVIDNDFISDASSASQVGLTTGGRGREADAGYQENPLSRSGSSGGIYHAKYDYQVLSGKRSTSIPIWRYRRPGDIVPRRTQSIDLGDDTLPRAAAEGRIADVHRLLQQGFNTESVGSRAFPQIPGSEGTTALYRAARAGYFEVVHLLLQHGANPNPPRQDGKSLMRLIANSGSVEMLRLLLEYGASFQNQGVLPQAALFGHIDVVQLLLYYGADINEVERQTALYRASSNGYSDIVELLLREGADHTITTPMGQPALFKAVQHENFKCVRLLLSYGARPSVGVGRNGETALCVACSLGHEPTVRLLLRRGAKPNELSGQLMPASHGWESQSIQLVRVNEMPLHAAARGSRISVARLLLDYGANIHARTQEGRSAVDIAVEKGHTEMVNNLLAAGAQLTQPPYNSVNKSRRLSDSSTGSDPRRPRRYSTAAPEVAYRDRKPCELQLSRPLGDTEPRRRSRSVAAGSSNRQGSSSTTKIGAAAVAMLLADTVLDVLTF